VHRTARYSVNSFKEGEPKTPQSRRRILLPSFVLEKLQEHRVAQDQHRVQAGEKWRNRNLVFCNKDGEFLYPDPLMKRFHALLAQAGLPAMHLHDLRHSAATILLSMGVNPKQVQELLGHSQINMTIGEYGHVFPSMQKEIAEKFDDLLS
jgi:integrase